MPLIQLDNQNPTRGLKLNFNKINTVVSDENAPQHAPSGIDSHLDSLKSASLSLQVGGNQKTALNNHENLLIKPAIQQQLAKQVVKQRMITDENLCLPVLKPLEKDGAKEQKHEATGARYSPNEPSPPKLKSYIRDANKQVSNQDHGNQLHTINQPVVNLDNLIDFSEDTEMAVEPTVESAPPPAHLETLKHQQPLLAHSQPESLISRIPRLSIKFPLSLVNQNRLNGAEQHPLASSRPSTARYNHTSKAKLLVPLAEKDKNTLVPSVRSNNRQKALELDEEDDDDEEEEIEDIDKDAETRDAILLVCDIAKDIYEYMYTLEEEQAIKQDYLRNEKIFTPRVRQRLVNWCIEIHSQLKLLPETLFLTISLIDRFFDLVSIKQQSQVQLIAVGAMLIASKYEEIYPPDIGDLMHLTANAYSRREIMRIEIIILEQLKFNLGKPIPLAFLRRFSRAAHCDLKMHSIAKYLMELSLTEYECSHWRPSMLAAAALFVTIHLVYPDQPILATTHNTHSYQTSRRLHQVTSSSVSRSPPAQDRWNKSMIHHTHYTRQQLLEPAATLAKLLKRAQKNPTAYYCVKKNLPNVGKWTELKSARIDELIKLADQI